MATYVNNLRLKEITTGDEDGTWGTSTNTNLELITDGFSYGTKEIAADANETFTMPDATADATRSLYLKFTSAVSLTATREITLGPNTVSKTWIIENATSGSQIITIKQGSGATVNVANGSKVMVVTDGAGAGAAVLNANPTEVVAVVDLTSDVTGTLPVANGGTGVTSSTGTGDTVLNVSPALTTPKITTGIQNASAATVISMDSSTFFAGAFSDEVTALGNTGAAVTIDCDDGNVFTATLTGNATITLASPNSTSNRATSFTLVLTNDATPSRTVAFAGGTFNYPGGSVSRTEDANATDIWFFFSPDNGTNWYVSIPMKDLSS
jgi:hypothetical protein